MNTKAFDAARHSIEKEAQTVRSVLDGLDEAAFGRAVDMLAAAPRIMTGGCGNSGIAAKKFAHCLCCINKSGMFMPSGEAVHGGMGFIRQGDVLVLVTRGGKTGELIPMADIARKRGAGLIVLTENGNSPLAHAADVTLLIHDIEESDPTGLMATSRFVAPVAIFDALLSALIVETGFVGGQFGLIHPGGAVGERLNCHQ